MFQCGDSEQVLNGKLTVTVVLSLVFVTDL